MGRNKVFLMFQFIVTSYINNTYQESKANKNQVETNCLLLIF